MANISVYVRIRPLLTHEVDAYQQPESRFSISADKTQIGYHYGYCRVDLSNKREKMFNFNRVFG